MKNFVRIVTMGVILSLVLGVFTVGLTIAQEASGAGEGGAIVWGNQRGSANIDPLNPLRCSGVDCSDIHGLLFPDFVGVDPATLSLQPNVDFSLVTGWEVSDDGLVYTFSLRDDMVWTDGMPVTAWDVFFFYEAMNKMDPAEVSSSLASARRDIVGASVIDDYTLELTYATPSCLALNRAGDLAAMPGQAYGWSPEVAEDFDYSVLVGHPFDDAPTISAGPFQFIRTDAGTAIYLGANQDYADPVNGEYVTPEGLIYLDVPDYNVMAERLIANQPGDVNFMNEPDTEVVPTLEQSNAQLFSAPGTLWHYVSLNIADPANSADGLDADGNPVEQGHHPILGDKRVRQALQHAINIEDIVNGPLNGNATAMVSGTIPTAYTAHPTLARRSFDLDEARRLLDEAGWVASGEPLIEGGDGLRIATEDALYADAGTEFRLDMVNPGDVRNDVSVLLQAMFAEIGVDVEVRPLDFNTMYDDNLGVQVYDTAVAGWRGGIPFNADQRNFFGAENDIVSDSSPGFNFGSWYNERFEELSAFINTNPGCDQERIIEAAYEVQEIMWEEQPYLFLYAFNSVYAATPNVDGFGPFPAQGTWNIDSWDVRQ